MNLTNDRQRSGSLEDTVLKSGLCIGCGVCASMAPAEYEMQWTQRGTYVASAKRIVRDSISSSAVEMVCPFSGKGMNEDELGLNLFPQSKAADRFLGHYDSLWVGSVADPSVRTAASSGGMGRWLLCELLRRGFVDKVIHVKAAESGNSTHLFQYSVTDNPEEIMRGARSAYYPISLEKALSLVRAENLKFALVGIPCFVKAVRLLAQVDPLIKQRIVYTIGLFCGHLKSHAYAEYLAWQVGVPAENLGGIDFRCKLDERQANEKGISVLNRKSGSSSPPRPVQEFFGGPYHYGLFQHLACDFCDDVVGETADVSVGDAWLPRFINDSRGTSIIIVRNPTIGLLINDARCRGELALESISPADVRKSQAGGFRQRREGLSYRLLLADQEGLWRPQKRVDPSDSISKKRKAIYRIRASIAKVSHDVYLKARTANNMGIIKNELHIMLSDYDQIRRLGWFARCVQKCTYRTYRLFRMLVAAVNYIRRVLVRGNFV